MDLNENIIYLIKKSKSINYISNHLNVGKGRIYYHYKKLNGRKNKLVKIKENDELKGEFIGLFCGDGYIKKLNNYKYKVQICLNSKDVVFADNLIKNVFIPLFNKPPIQYEKDSNLNLYYYSKPIYEFIQLYVDWDKEYKKTYTVDLIDKNYDDSFKIGFLRGSLDSDGHYSSKKIVFSSVSSSLITRIIGFLEYFEIEFGIYYYEEKRLNRMPITHVQIKKNNEVKFVNLIKPRMKRR